jgi:hypothetical protein
VEAHYSRDGFSALQTYRDMVFRLLTDYWTRLLESGATKNLVRTHPQLVGELVEFLLLDRQKEQETKKCTTLDIPKTRREKYES